MRETFAASLATGLVLGIIATWACTETQRRDARTALDVNICVQGSVLERIEDDLTDPFVAAELAQEIADRCTPKLSPTGDAGAP